MIVKAEVNLEEDLVEVEDLEEVSEEAVAEDSGAVVVLVAVEEGVDQVVDLDD